MGLVLFPGDGNNDSPDACWSYTRFATFRERLARTEGIDPSTMHGFGGDLPWTTAATPLAPLLGHPETDGPNLTPGQCAAMLPRLEEIIVQWQEDDRDPLADQHLDDARRLRVVLHFCTDRRVDLLFV
ncbi:hypothetical protein [Streptacidiphilus fuscans]|uniref:Uncharacterized protein n=1 Tax=Streptacidiphilus fuscans TaxID=2789292 RepID=A0A931FID0_9ACTN|nr:hypothetical protein [Streptacidiphilus fuscans]MBF9073160.1 hypothetical protein [Streptacidiphilus fuscans]